MINHIPQLDKKKASTLAEFSRKAAERHEIALNQLIAAKEQKLQNEAYVIKLKTEARKKEDEHTKRFFLMLFLVYYPLNI